MYDVEGWKELKTEGEEEGKVTMFVLAPVEGVLETEAVLEVKMLLR